MEAPCRLRPGTKSEVCCAHGLHLLLLLLVASLRSVSISPSPWSVVLVPPWGSYMATRLSSTRFKKAVSPRNIACSPYHSERIECLIHPRYPTEEYLHVRPRSPRRVHWIVDSSRRSQRPRTYSAQEIAPKVLFLAGICSSPPGLWNMFSHANAESRNATLTCRDYFAMTHAVEKPTVRSSM